MDGLLQDSRYALRALRQSPTFVTITVLLLGLVTLATCFIPARRATRVLLMQVLT